MAQVLIASNSAFHRPPGGRWNALLDATSTWANAVELDALSVKDNDRYENTEHNWRVLKGLGHPVKLGSGVGKAEELLLAK